MTRFLIEEAKCGVTRGGPDSSVVCSINYNDGNESKWLNLEEVMGIPCFSLADKDIYDKLIEDNGSDTEFWDYVKELEIMEFNGIALPGEYGDIYGSMDEDPDNPAVPLLRYIITLTRCPMDEVEGLIEMASGKYVDELEIPLSDIEEEFLEDEEEYDDDDDE